MLPRIAAILAILLLAPPLALRLAGSPMHGYFELPPMAPHLPPAHGFGGWWVLLLLLLLLGAALVFTGLGRRSASDPQALNRLHEREPSTSPRWTWLALLLPLGLVLAPWLAPGLGTLLALAGLGVTANLLSLRWSGHALLSEQPGLLLQMSAAGALLWWLMEYLNRYVESWLLESAPQSVWGYLISTTLAAMLLPPVILSLRQALTARPGLPGLLRGQRGLPLPGGEPGAVWGFAIALAGLFGGALMPSTLFPLLWLAPVLLLAIIGGSGLGAGPRNGDWGRILIPALAGMLAGALWMLGSALGGPHTQLSLPLPDCCPELASGFVRLLGFGLYGVLCLQLADLSAAGWRKRLGRRGPIGSKKLDIPIKVE